MAEALVINRQPVAPGTRVTIEVPLPPLYTHTPMLMPVHVIRGKRDGPRLFVSAAIHGDEINGVEIIRRLVRSTAIINPLKSLEMMLTGRALSARAARSMGLVDLVQPARQIERAVRQTALNPPQRQAAKPAAGGE